MEYLSLLTRTILACGVVCIPSPFCCRRLVVHRHSFTSSSFESQVLKTLLIVVALFAFCWLPLQSYTLLQDFFPQINE
jgi:hypothetical protein